MIGKFCSYNFRDWSITGEKFENNPLKKLPATYKVCWKERVHFLVETGEETQYWQRVHRERDIAMRGVQQCSIIMSHSFSAFRTHHFCHFLFCISKSRLQNACEVCGYWGWSVGVVTGVVSGWWIYLITS